jgi:tRNA threonylcarbamoyl adenosine modification protein YeaZ
MTTTLAIDTSTSRTSVAIVVDGKCVWSDYRDGATGHGHSLPELVHQGLASHPNIDRVVVGMGPGPFTGLRVGITFARAFALARGIEVHGACSLDAVALLHSDKEFVIATDARRKEIYWARYKDGIRVEGPAVNFPADVQGYVLDLYPDIARMVELSANQNYAEPFYLRRPDAVATADRP